MNARILARRRFVMGLISVPMMQLANGVTQHGNGHLQSNSRQPTDTIKQIDWDELLPVKERQNYETEAPVPTHNYLGEDAPAARQSGSSAINPSVDGLKVKIPGFVVPLLMSSEAMVSRFFLVPYFGACIHVPPPPPNQIIYVELDNGFRLSSIFDAQWATGILHIASKTLRMASASYTLQAVRVEPYTY